MRLTTKLGSLIACALLASMLPLHARAAAPEPLALAAGDVDGDGVPDLVVAYGDGKSGVVELRLGRASSIYPHWLAPGRERTADGPFSTVVGSVAVPMRPEAVAARDVDGDGLADVVVGRPGADSVLVLKADGAGGLAAPVVRSAAELGRPRRVTRPSDALSLGGDVVASLGMRLNEDAVDDLVVLRRGVAEPEVRLSRAATVFVVNTSVERGPGSLRQAILDANASPGADRIEFAIASGPQTIRLASPLPPVTEPLTIDATTQRGYAGTPLVELLGDEDEERYGISLASGDSVVRGLAINAAGPGLSIASDGNVVEANYFGISPDGTRIHPNVGVDLGISGGDDNIVGGTTPEGRNVFYGLHGAISTRDGDRNRFSGNFLGVSVDGTESLSFFIGGDVRIGGESAGNVVGGTEPGAGNLSGGGVDLSATAPGSANEVTGNSFAAYSSSSTGFDLYQEVRLGFSSGNPADPGDVDDGPNGLQNAPVLASARLAAGSVRIVGSLSSAPSTTYRVELFAGPSPEPHAVSAFHRFVGHVDVTTDASGAASIDESVAADGAAKGWLVAASATGPEGTSELSNTAVVNGHTELVSAVDYDASKPLLRVRLSPKNLKHAGDVVLFVDGEREGSAKVKRTSGTITLDDSNAGTIPIREGLNSIVVTYGGARTQAYRYVYDPAGRE